MLPNSESSIYFGINIDCTIKHILQIVVYILIGTHCLPAATNNDTLAKLPIDTLAIKAATHMENGNINEAIKYLTALVGQYHPGMTKREKQLCAKSSLQLSDQFLQREMYTSAFNVCLTGMRISEDNNFKGLLSALYAIAGAIYNSYNDKEVALQCYKKALELSTETGEKGVETMVLMDITGVYAFQGNVKMADHYLQKMLSMDCYDSVMINYFMHLATGYIQEAKNNNQLAQENFHATINHALRYKMAPRYTAASYTALARNYAKNGTPDSAIHYYEQSNAYCKKNSVHVTQRANTKALIELYSQMGNHSKVNELRQQYSILQDSILDIDEFTKFKNEQIVHELNSQFDKIMNLTESAEIQAIKIRQHRWMISTSGIGIVIIASMLMVVYRQKKKTQEAYHSLYQRNLEILRQYNELQQAKEIYEAAIRQRHNDTDGETETPPMSQDTSKLASSTYKLKDDQRNNLLEAINNVMQDSNNFCQPEFSLEKLANMVNSNSHYVSQIINETFSKNFRTYVNEFRIREASYRLLNSKEYGNYTIKAIGESVGFKSYSNFTDTFRKITGMTPSIFIKMAREEERQ